MKNRRSELPLFPIECSHTACTPESLCPKCIADQQFLRSVTRPSPGRGTSIRCVDLFSGCGGMTLGLEEAARRCGMRIEPVLAVDSDKEVIDIYTRNFPGVTSKNSDICALFDGDIGASPSRVERALAESIGAISVLHGGPPCQGHSDLNNHTRRRDPKNALYLKMARAAEVLRPDIVIIENVAPVQWDKSGVVARTREALEAAGYAVAARVLNLQTVGVPQRRFRFVLVASRIETLNPAVVFTSIIDGWGTHPPRTVAWAIRDLLDIENSTIFDTPSTKSTTNAKRMAYLFEHGRFNLPNRERPECHRDKEHSYVSVYGRLRWGSPAQTITTGFGSMGQGRYVHPQRRRTITPHEAARLQTFPDWFDFGTNTRRGVLAQAIGNAVPPLLMLELGRLILPSLSQHMAERLRA
jgi:DNA (cytosine-5)-methyltransferase 1